MSQHSKACCTIPPVVQDNYEPKGKYITIDGLKTYQTGPESASRAILYVFDIFGFFPQTIQGADILAYTDSDHSYQVFMPDWFEGKPADVSWYPPDSEDKKKKLTHFFGTTAAPDKTQPRIRKVVDEVQTKVKKFDKWAAVGFCWGGKMINLASQDDSLFKAGASCHPAMVDPEDAAKLTIPFAILPSKDEDDKTVEEWKKRAAQPVVVEKFPDQVHGFMAARADLRNEKTRKEYERGYQTLLNFFHEHV